MPHPVQQAPGPTAVHHVFQFAAVAHKQPQQIDEVGGGPVACDETFGQADVTRLEHCAADVPVLQHHGGVGVAFGMGLAKTLHRAIGQVQCQGAVAQLLQQFEHGAR